MRPSGNNRYFKLLLVIATFVLGMGLGYLVADNKSAKEYDHICSSYSGKIEDIEYVAPSYELTIGSNDDRYFIDIDLAFVDNGVVFTGEEAYMAFNMNGAIPYSVAEVSDTIAIPLEDGKLPARFSCHIEDDDYVFDKESQKILLDHLKGEREEVTVFSILIFAPDGKILHVANKIL